MIDQAVGFIISDTGVMLLRCAFILVVLLHVAPIMAWVERRGSALMQKRLGPNRVGPLGLLQALADAIKFIFKEDRILGHVDKFYFFLAPVVSLVPAFMTFAVIPFAGPIDVGGRVIDFQVANLNVGLLYVFAIASLGVYGIIMASWSSNSKYALFGGLRSASQMISYELSMGLSVIGMILIFSSVELNVLAGGQGHMINPLAPFGIDIGFRLPMWGIVVQPLGFLIFTVAAFAETNRLPFDLPEGESEIVAGYHLEYGAMKFAIFMMAEYVNMITASGLIVTLYFGGWQMLPGLPLLHNLICEALAWEGLAREWLRVAFEMASFFTKIGIWMWIFVGVRWTLPRFRYDQLMELGWKVMLPLSLLNIVLTAAAITWLR